MNYILGNTLGGAGALNADKLALNLQFAADKSLKPRRGPTPTFSRASGATQVGSTGLIEFAPENLVSRSQEINLWIGSTTKTTSTTLSPDGVNFATRVTSVSGTYGGVTRSTNNYSAAVGQSMTVSCWVKKENHRYVAIIHDSFRSGGASLPYFDLDTLTFNANGQGAFTHSIVSHPDGWYRISVSGNSINATVYTVDLWMVDSSGNAANSLGATQTVLWWGAQLERHPSARTYIPTTTAAVFNARFDHDPVTLACRGLLIEEGRTNLTVRSDDFSASEWNSASQRNLTVTANNTVSPSGATDADLLTVGATTTVYQVIQNLPATGNVTSGTAYTVSCYFKPNQVTRVSIWAGNTVTLPVDAMFDLTGAGSVVANAFGTASIQQAGNGWYRCIVTGTAGATSNTTLRFAPVSGTSRTYVGNSVDSFWAWGAQLEAGSFPTSYIPTTTASVVRSVDVCSITGASFTSFYNQSEGTLFVNAFTPANGDRTVFAIDDNTANEMIRLRTEGTNPFFKVTDGGSELVAIDAGTVIANTTFKLAGAYKLNDFASSINGGASVIDTTGTIPTVDRLRIGAGQSGNTMCGCISSLRYYKKRIANAKLQTLTA